MQLEMKIMLKRVLWSKKLRNTSPVFLFGFWREKMEFDLRKNCKYKKKHFWEIFSCWKRLSVKKLKTMTLEGISEFIWGIQSVQPFPPYSKLCGSVSLSWIRIRVHKVADYGFSLDPDPQHWSVLWKSYIFFLAISAAFPLLNWVFFFSKSALTEFCISIFLVKRSI